MNQALLPILSKVPHGPAAPHIANMRADWQRGGPVDALAILHRHPELAADDEVVLDLAYEEFCLRQARGESLDPQTFSERFGAIAEQLCLTLHCHTHLSDDRIYLLKDKNKIP